jgi:alcohol dehydrogenase class IV
MPTIEQSMQQGPWWSFVTAGRVVFGTGSSRLLPDAVAELGTRVLVCTDQNLVAAGTVGPIVAALRSSGLHVDVFDEGQAEIGFAAAERCAGIAAGFAPDVVVGLGGGSNLDLAKVVAARLSSTTPIARWRADGVPKAGIPVVAVPTTAGTGSEVTPIAVLTDEEHDTKVGFPNRSLLPRVAIVDPALTLSCPASVTAHSGMDAMTHAVESYLAIDSADKAPQPFSGQGFVGKNPVSDALALRAVELIGANLATAVADGADLAAREAMALGSLLAGMAFASAGTAVVHALQYPIGARTHTPHGLGNAVLLPAAIRFNLPARVGESAVLARALGSTAAGDAAAASELAGLLGRLALSVGITPNLRSIGMGEADLAAAAADASRITRLVENNPRHLDEAALLAVLSDALDYSPG